MNGRERVLNMIQGKEFDRRPFGAVLSLYGAKLTGCPVERYYSDAKEYARGQDAILRKIDPDVLAAPFLPGTYGEAFGSAPRREEGRVPGARRRAAGSDGDLSGLSCPDIERHPGLAYIRESVRLMHAAHGREKIIAAAMPNPLDLPAAIIGLEAWTETVLSDEIKTERMLSFTVPFFVSFCNALFKDGADLVVLPTTFLTRHITSRRSVEEFAMPALSKAFAQVNGPLLLHYTGSSFVAYLGLMAGLPHVAGFTLDHRDDFGNARRCVREEQILVGGFDGPTLHFMDASWIRSRCLSVLGEWRGDRRFVPFASGTDLPMETPLENILALREAVEEFGNA